MRRFLFPTLATLLCACGGPVREGNAFRFREGGMTYGVEFRGEHTVRILVHPDTARLVTRRLAVDTAAAAPVAVRCASSNGCRTFATAQLEVRFDRRTGLFSFCDARSGELLLAETARRFAADTVGGEACYAVVQQFAGEEDESLYGLGQYQTGTVDCKRDTVLLLQANKEIVNPYLVSTRGFGLLWDNYSASEFRDRGDRFEFRSEVADAVDYWVVAGGDPAGCVAGYRALTGAASMLPKWVFGFWQSRERYKSFDELEAVVREYRRRRIPLDVIVQDWEYWGDKPHWNSLTWDPARFPDPAARIARLHERYGVRLMLSVWPGFGPETAVYRELDEAGALFDERTWAGYKVFDAYDPAARDIFWRHFERGLLPTGVDGWWMDATEPSFREGFTQRRQEARTKSAGRTHWGAFHRYLNTYSLVWMGDLYARLWAAQPERRPFLFTRSAFAGQQRYATAVWSGDVVASWEAMKRQLAGGVNLAASGFPWWTFDIGGFFVSSNGGQYPRGLADPDYRNLYARWFQFGALVPIFRAHGTDVPREVWQMGGERSVWYRNQLKYIDLRYRLMPYIYSTAYGVAMRGESFLEALGMAFPADRGVRAADDAYLFGPSLLVRPVFEPLPAGAGRQRVATRLPQHAGTWWYDFETGEALAGGCVAEKACDLTELPLYARGGSILPLGAVKQSVGEGPDRELEIRIYAGADARFTLYDDAGDGFGYLAGECAKCTLDWSEADSTLHLSAREGSWEGMAAVQELTLRLYRPGVEPVGKRVRYTGEPLDVKF
ncbi:TIM-barrel domain-containing protein [Alistipes sp.]|uniref:glycoside hydrolase family 31 protein n=1 Tax=Alistipes sp. TaxID=1872444 RepID=UPI003AEFD188